VSTKYVDIPKAEVERLAIRSDKQVIELARVTAPAPAPAGAGSGSGAAGAGAAPEDDGAGSAAAPAESWTVFIDGNPVKLAAGESLDTEAIDRFLGMATSIELKTPADPKRDASKPTATITLHRKKVEDAIILEVIADGESYWIKQRGVDRAILVDKFALADLVEVERDRLVKKPPPPEPAPGTGSGSAAAIPPAIPGLPAPPAPPARPAPPRPAPPAPPAPKR
jgi:hypothetical protein